MSANEHVIAQVKLMELLSSRICHDIISPVGAIHNGLEFLEDMGADALEDALELMKHSTKQATVKLQTYRMAYGAGGASDMITYKNVYETIQTYFDLEKKITLNWDGEHDQQDRPAGTGKMAIGAFLLIAETLPKSGTITVSANGEHGLTFKAEGENCAFRNGTEGALDNAIHLDEIDPRLIHPFVLGLSAKTYGFSLKTEHGNETATLHLTKD